MSTQRPHTPDFDPYHRWLGIPAKDQPPTYYRLLGLDAGETDPDVIRDAAEQRMAHVRTYQLGQYTALSQRILNEIGRAKGCLLNPAEKQNYDALLQKTRDARGQASLAPAANAPVLPPKPRLMPRPPSARLHPAARNRPNRRVWSAVSGASVLIVVAALFALSSQRDSAPPIAESPKPPPAAAKTKASAPIAPSPIAASPRTSDQPPPRAAASPPVQPVAEPQVPPSTPLAATAPSATTASPDASRTSPPGNAAPSVGPSDAENAEPPPVHIALPSGAYLTQMMLDVPLNWQTALFPDDAVVYVAHYPNNAIQGVYSLKNAKLDGAAATLHENGQLRSLAFYANANRHGPLKQWNEAGQRLVYMDFKNGRKHGIVCLFQEGVPWLIQEFDRGNRQSEHLVRTINGVLRILTEAEINGETRADRDKAAEQLLALEAKLKESENKLKSEMAEWYRKEDQRLKRERVNDLAPARHEAAMRRIDERNAERSGAMDGLWRSALRRGGL